MARSLWLIALLIIAWSPHVLAQSPVTDEFQIGVLDWTIWCPCQINTKKAPIRFSPDPDPKNDKIISIIADDNSLGGNKCRAKKPQYECSPPRDTTAFMLYSSKLNEEFPDPEITLTTDEPEPLGPSFIHRPAPLLMDQTLEKLTIGAAKNPYCTPDVIRRAKAAGEDNECIQRQELRTQEAHLHDISRPYLYSMRFRMPSVIEDRTNSIRWVIAQWKHEPVSERYAREFKDDWGPSPFLAQRLDDGVLHVTVQDEHCRCMVASAPNASGASVEWKNGKPNYCLSTRPNAPANATCEPDLNLEYGTNPVLSSPIGQWVEMTYRVEANRSKTSRIEVYQDGRFIVRVIGKLGYDVDGEQTSFVKFKFGQYRDYMPYVHAMDVDWVRFEPIE
jgi:hypothetical protein